MISCKNIGISFSKLPIFSDISLEIESGTITALMGVNGCGKSTLLKILGGVLSPTEGEVICIDGIKISYIPDHLPALPFKVEEYLLHMGRIQGVQTKAIDEYINNMFKSLNIPMHIRKQRISKCSKGTVQKVNIMQALITKPDLLLLDEPFSGLDEKSLEDFINILKQTADSGTAVVLSCHEKEHMRKVAHDLYVFIDGTCVKEGVNQ